MKIKVVIFIVLTSVVSFVSLDRQATAKSNEEIQEVLKELAESNGLVGTHFVALVDENGLSFVEHYSKESQSFDSDTKFLVASHTKAMTSTLLSILHANKEIDLFKPVNEIDPQILSNKNLNTHELTLHQLLTHTGGFTSISHTFKSSFLGYKDRNDLVESLNNKTLIAADYEFRYSNTGPIVASMYAETSTSNSWHKLMQSRLLKPLDMTNTTTKVEGVTDLLPSITSSRDGQIFNTGHYKSNQTMHPSGGIVSTVNDLAKWLKANINQEYDPLSEHNVFELLHTKQVTQNKDYFTYKRYGYSLGWDLADYNGEKLLTRFGNYAGYSVHVSFIPARKIGVIAFTNQDVAYALPHVIANYTYNVILGKSNKIERLKEEAQRLNKSVTKSLATAPKMDSVVAASGFPNELLGKYVSEENWPIKRIYIENNLVRVSWGTLEGTLLKEGEKYIANFGPLVRKITWSSGVDGKLELKNGSLVYHKY